MPSIDERVVSMAFENSVFEQRVAQTMTTLSKLDTAIKNIGSTNGLQNIEAAANKVTLQGPMSALDKLKAKLGGAGQGAAEGFSEIDKAGNKVTLEGPGRAIDKTQAKLDQLSAGSTFTDIEKASNQVELSGLARALDNVTGKFSVLQGAASVALGNITSQAAMKGASFAKSFAFGPLTDGLNEYKTNLNSIQTILANTEGQQVSGLKAVNEHLDELNTYSDQTIYNFSEMAKNIGTFTAAGVDLDTSTQSIKGIANLAALSGSSSQQASTAMYQLSQAIAAGRVGLQDWNSVVNAGMGGAKFQQSLMRTAENMGALEKGAVNIDKATGKATVNGESFRNSIMAKPGEESWLTSEVLTSTLQQFTGDMKEADLIAQGFSKAQAQAIMQQAKTAKAAATEVKTLSQVFDVARESIGSGWAKTFQLVFGNFEQAKKTFTELSNFINGFISRTSDARNKLLEGWNELGGRTKLIEGIKELFVNVRGWILPIIDAFKEIFPPQTAQGLFDLTKKFNDFAHSLDTTDEFAENIGRTFKGVFAVLHIGWSIVKGVVGVIGDLLGVVGKGSGGFFSFTGSIGDFLVAIDNALTKGGLLTKFFDGLSAVLQLPLQLLSGIAGLIFGLFGDGDTEGADKFAESTGRVNEALKPAEKLLNNVKKAWEGFKDLLGDIRTQIEPWLTDIGNQIANFATLVADAIKNADWNLVFAALQTSFIGGLFLIVKKAIGGGIGDIGGGLMDSVKGVLGGVTDHLKIMQQEVKANILLKIAAAIGILAIGIGILSLIEPGRLTSAMTAIAVGLGQLMGAMALMTKVGGGLGKSAALLPVIAASLLIMSAALVVLAGAMTLMARLDWEEIAKGLVGIGGALAAVGVGVRFIGPGLIPAALAMIPLAIGLNLIALAVKQFASMKWEDLAKGLLGVGAALGAIALGMAALPVGQMLVVGAGLILVGIGLNLLSGAVLAFGSIPFDKMLVGLFGVAGSLAAIGLAISLIPPTVALQAAGLLILAVALQGIAAAIAVLGNLSLGTIVKGLGAIAGALIIFAIGLTAMAGTLPGAVALLAAAAALAILAPAVAFLGTLKWSTILKGLAAMALILGVLSIAGLAAAPGLIALGAAIAVLGLGLLPTAAAMYLFAKGLSLLASEGQKGIAVLLTALTAFIALLPTIVINFVKGLVGIVQEVVKLAPDIISALGVIIGMVLATVIEAAPKLAQAISVLLDQFVFIINQNSAKVIEAGIQLILNFLGGIDRNIAQIVTRVGNIITQFLNAMTTQAPRIVAAGTGTLVAYLQGITNNIPKLVATVAAMINKFINAVASHIPKITGSAVNLMVKFVGAITGFVPKLVAAGTNILLSFMSGIGDAIPRLAKKGLEVAGKFLNGIADGLSGLAQIGFRAIIRFLNGLEQAIRDNFDDLMNAGAGVADAIIDGLVDQFGKLGGVLRKALEKVFSLLPGWAKKILGIKSPSKVFMEIGKYTMLGFKKGVEDNSSEVTGTAETIGGGFLGAFRNIFGIHSPSAVMREIGQQVNRGFADGLRGSQDDIRNAFTEMNDKLTESMRTARQAIAENQKILDDQRASSEPDYEAIKAAEKAIATNEAILRRTTAAHDTLTGSLRFTKNALIGLKTEYDNITKKLDEANQTLDEATRARDDARRSLTDKFSTTPTVDDESKTKVEDYVKALTDQITATKSYTETLAKLRALGLDDTTYQKLLDEGLAGKDFAEQILAGGKSAVEDVNKLDAELLAASTTLAQNAATALYQAGVDAAQGLVNGLAARKGELEKQMENLAISMVNAIKRQLKIKSPSRVLMDVGKFTAEGVILGLKGSAQAVRDAAAEVGDDAASAMSTSLSHISDALSSEIDPDLTITPVLDLSQVQKDAKKLGDLTNVTPITAAASFGQASALSQEVSSSQEAQATDAAAAATTFMFEQNNYSPEALSEIEIYRQTNNQLAQLKSAVGLVS